MGIQEWIRHGLSLPLNGHYVVSLTLVLDIFKHLLVDAQCVKNCIVTFNILWTKFWDRHFCCIHFIDDEIDFNFPKVTWLINDENGTPPPGP